MYKIDLKTKLPPLIKNINLISISIENTEVLKINES